VNYFRLLDDLLETCVKLLVIQTPASSLHTPCIFSIHAITYSVLPLASHACVRRKREIFNTANKFSTVWRGAEFPSGLSPGKGSVQWCSCNQSLVFLNHFSQKHGQHCQVFFFCHQTNIMWQENKTKKGAKRKVRTQD